MPEGHKMKVLLVAIMSLAPLFCRAGDLPPASTPGALNPAVTQDNIDATICAPPTIRNGKKVYWTKTVRPSAKYTNRLKAAQMQLLGLSGDPHRWEEDHRVPLECGGNPKDPENLWPQPWRGARNARMKDHLENVENDAVCARKITLAECQAVFLGDFWAEYDRRFPSSTPRSR